MVRLLQNSRRPDISFNRSNGLIRINARLAKTLHLQPGDTINIMQDNGEFLLYAIHLDNPIGQHEPHCYPTKKGSHNYCAKSVRLCRAMMTATGTSTVKVSYIVGSPILRGGTTYVPIITKLPL